MEKAFDLKDLEQRLKDKGLNAVEGLAEIVAGSVFDWAKESCQIHPNLLVKSIGSSAVDILRPLAMEQIDKIDGQPG